jgi:putative SOS response-associated peptidase YedK
MLAPRPWRRCRRFATPSKAGGASSLSGFYEWKKTPEGKIPYAIVPKDEPLFPFAGLWENWRDKSAAEGAEWIRPNEVTAPIHDRMPVILSHEAWSRWLGPGVLPDSYEQKGIYVVQVQLEKAGVRLAAVPATSARRDN